MNTIITPNMLEVAYLLDRRHQITHVGTQASWPYGIEELAVTLAGENIDLDHANFLRHGECRNLVPLAKTFAAIQAIIDQHAEAAAFAGGAQ
jgi:hypothetical protein